MTVVFGIVLQLSDYVFFVILETDVLGRLRKFKDV